MFNTDVILNKKDAIRLFGVLISTENDTVNLKTQGQYIWIVPIAELKDARLRVDAREIRQWMQNRGKS